MALSSFMIASTLTLALGCGDDDVSGDAQEMPATTAGDDSGETAAGPNGSETGSDGGSVDTTGTPGTSGTSAADDQGTTSSAADTSATDDGSEGDGATGGIICEGPAPTCRSTAVAHCDFAAVGICAEYYDDCVVVPEAIAGCTRSGGTWGEGACPSAGQYGICLAPGTVQTGLASYDFAGQTAEQAQDGCEGGGGDWCPA